MIKYISDKFFQVKELGHNYKFISIFTVICIFLNGNIYGQKLTAEQIYEKVKDAVVVILAYDYSDEPTKQGSGVVLNDKGYVVTNYHVLSGCERLEIVHGEEIIPYVDIIGIDVEKDILILKIDEKKFPSVKIGDIKKLKVGQRVYAIGSPMGFENTISEGIISGLRSYDELSKNYIQVTASISHGSSGGAVVNDKGELIGISTLTAEEGQNLNFAVPIDEVLSVEIDSYGNNERFKDFEMFSKGVTAFEIRAYEEAVKYFSQFLDIYSSDANAYNNRGLSKYFLSDFNGAIQDYSKAIEINPYDANSYTNRGDAKSELIDYYGAILDYSKAIEINSSYFRAYFNRGLQKYKLEKNQEAIKDYSKAIEINPNYYKAYTNRAITKADLGDYMGALQDYNKSIEINSDDPKAFYNRGVTKYKLGDKVGACFDWSRAGEMGYYNAYDAIRQGCN